MKLRNIGLWACLGTATGIGAYKYRELKPVFEVKLVSDTRDSPMVRMVREGDQTYFGRLCNQHNCSIQVNKSLFNKYQVPGEPQINSIATMTFTDTPPSVIEKNMYTIADTMMGIPVFLYLAKIGENKGAATAHIQVDRSGHLQANTPYKMVVTCYQREGRNYFMKALVVDEKGNLVRTYRSRFAKVDWTIKSSIQEG